MNKHIFQGLVCGGIFASVITWVAALGRDSGGRLCITSFGGLRSDGRPLHRRTDCSQFCDDGGGGEGKERSDCAPDGRGTSNGLNQRHRRSYGQYVRRECRNWVSFARSKWGGFHVMRDPPLSPVPFTNRLLKKRRGARR